MFSVFQSMQMLDRNILTQSLFQLQFPMVGFLEDNHQDRFQINWYDVTFFYVTVTYVQKLDLCIDIEVLDNHCNYDK